MPVEKLHIVALFGGGGKEEEEEEGTERMRGKGKEGRGRR